MFPSPPVPSSSPEIVLTIDKSVAEEFTNPLASVNYTIVVKNVGETTAYNVILTDALPEGFTYSDNGAAEKEWILGDMISGSSKEVNYLATVGEKVEKGKYVNIAKVSADNFDPISDDEEIEVRIIQVLGQETKRLPETGIDQSAIALWLASFLTFFIGVFSRLKSFFRVLARKKRILFGFLSLVSAIILVYPFLPLIEYYLMPPVEAEFSVISSQPILGQKTDNSEIASIKQAGNQLIIPKIGVKIPIIEGQNESALERGAWRLPETSTPDKGSNTVVAAHRFKYIPPHEKTFYLLDKLTEGDTFKVFWEGKEYDYRVISSRIVSPEAIEVLDKTNVSTFTLVTCNPLFSNRERLVVAGELVSSI